MAIFKGRWYRFISRLKMEPNRAQLLVDRMEINANSKEKRMIAMLDLK